MDTDRDKDLKALEQAMKGVAPLGGRSRADQPTHTPTASAPDHPPPKIAQTRAHPLNNPHAPAIDGKTVLAWRRAGLLNKDYQNLRRGKLSPPPKEADLHGLDSDEACAAITNAITRAQLDGQRCLCLIHGKGHHSESRGSRLKGLVNDVLRRHPEVLGFHSVPHNTGAVNVLLRRLHK